MEDIFDVMNVFSASTNVKYLYRRQQMQTTLRRFCRRRWDVFANGKITTFCYGVSWRHKDTFVDGKTIVCMSDNDEAFVSTALRRLTTLISTTLWSLTTLRRINWRCVVFSRRHNPVFSLTWRQCYKTFYFLLLWLRAEICSPTTLSITTV
jgi:hypothetical protein